MGKAKEGKRERKGRMRGKGRDEAGFGQEGSKTKVKITSYSNTLNTIIFDTSPLTVNFQCCM